jgi:hypothetical protein
MGIRYELQRRIDADLDLKNISVLSPDPGGYGRNELGPRGVVVCSYLHASPIAADSKHHCLCCTAGIFHSPKKPATDVSRACSEEERLGKLPKVVFLDKREKAKTLTES